MDGNLNASKQSTPSNTNVSTLSEMPPVSVLVDRKGDLANLGDERQKLLIKVNEGQEHIPDPGSPETPKPRVPMYEELRQKSMETNKKAMRKLIIVLLTSCIFIVVEILGGYYANSIAIMSDAAHIASDVAGFGISICALKIAHRHANK